MVVAGLWNPLLFPELGLERRFVQATAQNAWGHSCCANPEEKCGGDIYKSESLDPNAPPPSALRKWPIYELSQIDLKVTWPCFPAHDHHFKLLRSGRDPQEVSKRRFKVGGLDPLSV